MTENFVEEVSAVDLRTLFDSSAEGAEVYSNYMRDLRSHVLTVDKGRNDLMVIDVGNGEEEMTVGLVLANLALLTPYQVLGIIPDHTRFVRKSLSSDVINDHMSTTIEELYHNTDPENLSLLISSILAYMADLGCDVAGRVGTTVSIRGLFDAARKDPEIANLLNWKVPSGTLEEIELAAEEASKEMNTRLKALDCELGRMLRCGAAVNTGQLRQAIVNIGLKPGLMDGELIPEPVDTNFVRGLRNVEDYYICSIGARKALTTNFKQVKNSGYLSRKLVLLVVNHFIDINNHDCGTHHGITTVIQSEDHAKRLSGRYIKKEDGSEWRIFYTKELLKMIGETVILRSPITCSGEEGICFKCYGEHARSNKNIHAGIYGVLIISEQLTQMLLGSKHLLKARPVSIAWPEGFLDSFSIERASVIPESTVDRIFIDNEDIEENEEDGNRMTSCFYYRANGKHARIKIETPVPLILNEEVWDVESEGDELVLSPTLDSTAFFIPVANSDLSEALHSIFGLIERDDLTDMHEAYSRLMDLFTRSSIKSPSVHAEIILRAMIRSTEDNMARPDFSGPDMPSYAIMKLKQAIFSSASITNSLAFERVKAQLTSTEILRKTQASAIDTLIGG